MIHLRLIVREEAVENPIENARGEERVDVTDGKAVELMRLAEALSNDPRCGLAVLVAQLVEVDDLNLQMLSSNRDACRSATSYLDIVDETWKRRNTANEESSDCAPVGCKLGRVAVDSVEIVHVRHGDPASSYDEVATIVSYSM